MFKIKRDKFVYIDDAKRIGECLYDVIATIDSLWIVVLTELVKNPGPSVTNAIDHIVPQFCRANGLTPKEVLFLERYQTHPDYLDTVHYKEDGTTHWSRLQADVAQPILELLK